MKFTLIYENGFVINATEWLINDSNYSEYKIFLVAGDLPKSKIMLEKESPFSFIDSLSSESSFFSKT